MDTFMVDNTQIATLTIIGPEGYKDSGGVILQISNGKKVIAQLKSDGTLLLSGIHIEVVDKIEPCHIEQGENW